MSVAQGQVSWNVPPASTEAEIAQFSDLATGAAISYLESQVSQTVTGFSFVLIGELAGTALTIGSMASAYNSCAP